jgi:hypothetical protein
MTMPTPAESSFEATIPAKTWTAQEGSTEDVLGTEAMMEDPGRTIYRCGDSYVSLVLTLIAPLLQRPRTLGRPASPASFAASAR